MTIAPEHPTIQSEQTTESRHVAALRAQLRDPSQQPNWPEIQRAIDYLIADTFLSDLAA